MLETFAGIEEASQSQNFKGLLYWVPDACNAREKTEKAVWKQGASANLLAQLQTGLN